MELGLGLTGERGLSLEAGVRSAGEAMGFLLEEEQRESVFYRGVVRRPQGSCHVGLSPYPYSWLYGRDHTQSECISRSNIVMCQCLSISCLRVCTQSPCTSRKYTKRKCTITCLHRKHLLFLSFCFSQVKAVSPLADSWVFQWTRILPIGFSFPCRPVLCTRTQSNPISSQNRSSRCRFFISTLRNIQRHRQD